MRRPEEKEWTLVRFFVDPWLTVYQEIKLGSPVPSVEFSREW
jgi:hypothetical protein